MTCQVLRIALKGNKAGTGMKSDRVVSLDKVASLMCS
jgi:hypothetical protein